MSRPKGFAPWDPNTETLVVLDNVERILDEYSSQLPLTARQIFYRLVGAYGYDKTEKAYKRLTGYLVRARRARLISFSAIRDDGTTAMGGTGYESPGDFWQVIRDSARWYARDLTAGQDVAIEVWCEAAGMAPQLSRVARDYDVSVYATGGFSSVTETYKIAQRIAGRDRPTVFMHLGDFDPSGESIFESMSQDIGRFVAQRGGHIWRPATGGVPGKFEPVRVALTRAQVETYDLPTAPPKSTDSRSVNWVGETTQAEALPPDLLAEILRTAIEERLDLDLIERVKAEADGERDVILARIDEMLGEEE